MRDYNVFREEFIKAVQEAIPGAVVVSGGNQIQCRCRYCSDSKNLRSLGHMYISIPFSRGKQDPVMFNCFKCNSKGIASGKVLNEWGINNELVLDEVDEYNGNTFDANVGKEFKTRRHTFNNFILDENVDLVQPKLDYLNNRLGQNLTVSEYISNRVVFNILDGLRYSRINKYTRDPRILEELNKYFVGFLSMDGNSINLRRIVDEGIVNPGIDKRYINYNIREVNGDREKYFALPLYWDLAINPCVPIHIAEGPMDILSIYYNVRNRQPGLYAAVGGASYLKLMEHLTHNLKIWLFEMHIYPDNDNVGSEDKIKDLSSIMHYRFPYNNIFVHRNTYPGEKDFGVPMNRISETIMPI